MGREKVKEWLSARFPRLLRHYRTDADLSEELKTHVELQEEDYVGAGIPAPEARRRARLSLGNTQVVVEKVRDQELITMLESCYRDFCARPPRLAEEPGVLSHSGLDPGGRHRGEHCRLHLTLWSVAPKPSGE
jgi:hypothetical protein